MRQASHKGPFGLSIFLSTSNKGDFSPITLANSHISASLLEFCVQLGLRVSEWLMTLEWDVCQNIICFLFWRWPPALFQRRHSTLYLCIYLTLPKQCDCATLCVFLVSSLSCIASLFLLPAWPLFIHVWPHAPDTFPRGWGVYLDCSMEFAIPSRSTTICSWFTPRSSRAEVLVRIGGDVNVRFSTTTSPGFISIRLYYTTPPW